MAAALHDASPTDPNHPLATPPLPLPLPLLLPTLPLPLAAAPPGYHPHPSPPSRTHDGLWFAVTNHHQTEPKDEGDNVSSLALH
jgi:hypothetical protein